MVVRFMQKIHIVDDSAQHGLTAVLIYVLVYGVPR